MTVADPVASVVLDVALAHLDRPFDYLVPAALAAGAGPGVRVRVRFAGQQVGGFVVARSAASGHPGRLAPLSALVSAERVLTPDVLAVARSVADRYGGTLADVLRLAVPPRHARVEAAVAAAAASASPAEPPGELPADQVAAVRAGSAGSWAAYPGGAALLDRLGAGGAPRAAVAALPGDGPALLAGAVAATVAGGRRVLVLTPDATDLAAVSAAVRAALPGTAVAELTADAGPAARYRSWLSVLHGRVPVVLGTRAAAFAPVADLGLVACWDDGDDLLAEPRAPYPHAREVLVRRSVDSGAGLLLAGHVVTPEAVALSRDGFLAVLAPERATVRARTPRVVVSGDDVELGRDPAARAARLPGLALRTARAGLARGPVLVQVPHAGYLPVLACGDCRRTALCDTCGGPLARPGPDAPPACRWCGRPAAAWTCPHCGSVRLRSRRVGAQRTAEEIGRAFPGFPVLRSGRDSADAAAIAAAATADRPAVVVATPGAEPAVPGGYAAALLLDADAVLARPGLATGQEALRRWANAAALVRTGADGGTVVLVGDAGRRPVQALVRWDPVGAAGAEVDDRVATGLPPAAVVAELTGAAADVADLLDRVDLPATAELLGPVPVAGPAGPAGPAEPAPQVRALLRDRRGRGGPLIGAVVTAQRARTARKLPHVRLRVDPVDLG